MERHFCKGESHPTGEAIARPADALRENLLAHEFLRVLHFSQDKLAGSIMSGLERG